MGSEKRLSESRNKETTEKAREPRRVPDGVTRPTAAPSEATVLAPKPGTSTGRALTQVLLLYLIPILLIIVIGKVLLNL